VLEPSDGFRSDDGRDVALGIRRVDEDQWVVEGPLAVVFRVELDRRVPVLGGGLDQRPEAAVFEDQQLGQVARESRVFRLLP